MTIYKKNELQCEIITEGGKIEISWKELLDILEIMIYGEPEEKITIIRTTERRIENKIERK